MAKISLLFMIEFALCIFNRTFTFSCLASVFFRFRRVTFNWTQTIQTCDWSVNAFCVTSERLVAFFIDDFFFASHRNLHNFIIEYFLRVNRYKSDVSQSTIQFSQVVYLRSRWDRSINKPWIHQLRAIKQIYLAWHVFINIKSWKRTARRHSVSTKKKKSFRAEQDEDGKKQFVCTKEAAEAASSTFFLSLIFHPRQCLA